MTTMNEWHLTPYRVAIHRASATAVLADLHLGYQEARRQSGDSVPIVSVATLMSPLLAALREFDAKNLVIAGDLFEAAYDSHVWREFQEALGPTGVRFLGLIPGNHDRALDDDADLPLLADGYTVGRWRIVHGHGPLPAGPVVLGHVHPCISHGGRKYPCYLAGEHRLVLPAYSPDAAGINVRALKRWQDCRCLAIVSGKLIDVPMQKAPGTSTGGPRRPFKLRSDVR